MSKVSLLTSNGNANKLPYLLSYLKAKDTKDKILNFGCGKHYKKHERMFGASLINYDCNIEEVNKLPNINQFQVVVCNNVLNVIEDTQEIKDILDYFDTLKGKKIFITVYEGDKTGEGKYTVLGTYQHNKKLKDWDILWSRGYKRIGKIAYKEI